MPNKELAITWSSIDIGLTPPGSYTCQATMSYDVYSFSVDVNFGLDLYSDIAPCYVNSASKVTYYPSVEPLIYEFGSPSRDLA